MPHPTPAYQHEAPASVSVNHPNIPARSASKCISNALSLVAGASPHSFNPSPHEKQGAMHLATQSTFGIWFMSTHCANGSFCSPCFQNGKPGWKTGPSTCVIYRKSMTENCGRLSTPFVVQEGRRGVAGGRMNLRGFEFRRSYGGIPPFVICTCARRRNPQILPTKTHVVPFLPQKYTAGPTSMSKRIRTMILICVCRFFAAGG